MLDFDEINRLAKQEYETVSEQPIERQRVHMCDWLEEMLIDAYIAGLTETGLPIDPVMDNEHFMYDVLFKVIGGETFKDRMSTHVQNKDAGRIGTLAESEMHRVYENGAYDAAEQLEIRLERQRAGTGIRRGQVIKTWKTMRDPRVRDTHDFIEGVSVPIEDRFYTYDGDSARFPGDFSKPENVVNCRCVLKYSVK
jgi:hypothetical protein